MGIHAGDGGTQDSLHVRQADTGMIEENLEAPEAAKRPVGTAWRDGSHMTIPRTTMYELNPATGQVSPLWTCTAGPLVLAWDHSAKIAEAPFTCAIPMLCLSCMLSCRSHMLSL